ncbi:MAG: ImmA/IrrE family metallo-endopeptidase [Polyangia bacterium]
MHSAASRLLDELHIRHPHEIDAELIAAHQNLFVRYRPLVHEAGHLLRTGKVGLIVIAESARRSEHWRWVIAHELGHFLRHPDVDQFKACTDANLREWYRTSGNEVEANEFAAELLMPEHLFKPFCDRNRPSMKEVSEIATRFRTSLTATAIRFVTFADEPCAVVHSANGVVEWSRTTRNFPLFIKRGHKLTTMTYAGDFFAGNPVEDRPQLIDGSGWTDDDRAGHVDLQEHSIMLGGYGTVLTFLWHKWR